LIHPLCRPSAVAAPDAALPYRSALVLRQSHSAPYPNLSSLQSRLQATGSVHKRLEPVALDDSPHQPACIIQPAFQPALGDVPSRVRLGRSACAKCLGPSLGVVESVSSRAKPCLPLPAAMAPKRCRKPPIDRRPIPHLSMRDQRRPDPSAVPHRCQLQYRVHVLIAIPVCGCTPRTEVCHSRRISW
jgi:hypothetical protein